jgi:hypothetical protein
VKALVDEAYARATAILTERRAVLDDGARLLLAKETLNANELPFGPVASPALSAAVGVGLATEQLCPAMRSDGL